MNEEPWNGAFRRVVGDRSRCETEGAKQSIWASFCSALSSA